MIIKIKQVKHISLLIFYIVMLSIFVTSAPVYSKAIARGLTLSPLRTELEVVPGTSQKGILTITNSSDNAMTVTINAEEFDVVNQQYDYAFTAESNVAKWVIVDAINSDLGKGETRKVGFVIGVPLSAEPGGRYISLFASTNTLDKSEGVQSRQRVASLIYINVKGDVSRAGNLVSLNSPWAIGEESKWSAAIQNTGTTHFRSRYSVQLDNLWGGEVSKVSGDSLILPGTIRLVSDAIPLPKLPGIYRAIYNIGLGDTPVKSEVRFILYMPYTAILVLAVTLLITILVIAKKQKKK